MGQTPGAPRGEARSGGGEALTRCSDRVRALHDRVLGPWVVVGVTNSYKAIQPRIQKATLEGHHHITPFERVSNVIHCSAARKIHVHHQEEASAQLAVVLEVLVHHACYG